MKYLFSLLALTLLLSGCRNGGTCERVSRNPYKPAAEAPNDDVAAIDVTLTVSDVTGCVGTFIKIEAQTNGQFVEFVCLNDGLAVFPRSMLNPAKAAKSTVVTTTQAGDYPMLAYTALNNEPSEPVKFTVHVKSVGPAPQPLPGPLPNPQPQPNPNPQPKPVDPVPPLPGPQPLPVLPTGKYALAEFTRSTVLAGVPSAKRTVCKAIGENYAVVSAQIAAGTIKTLLDANTKIKTGNHTIIADADNGLWSPVFSSLNAKVNGLGIKALTDWQQVFTELGQGFTAAGEVP